jgi:signal transduction histidine kinase
MKCDIPAPIERLIWFKRRLGLAGKELDTLNEYRGLFVGKKKDFSEHFYDYFVDIPATSIFLEHEKHQGHLRTVWGQWFESLFKEDDIQRLLHYLWRSGLRHVETNVDQRFINLGFSVVRQFCQNVVKTEVPVTDKETLLVAIDKLVDVCLLVETQAFIAATSQCDMEVVKGISHQVRNPLTIIGGNIARLKRSIEAESPIHKVYDTILEENKRLEKMVIDVGIYSEMFEKEPAFSESNLKSLIESATDKLKKTEKMEGIHLDLDLAPEVAVVTGDPEDLGTMFYYLLQNSLEAVDPKNPSIKISSRLKGDDSSFAEVIIFNTGISPSQEDLDNLFVPFYSSKPQGTGFGLPIAQLAARKSLGDLYVGPDPDGGTRCTIVLPIPPSLEKS